MLDQADNNSAGYIVTNNSVTGLNVGKSAFGGLTYSGLAQLSIEGGSNPGNGYTDSVYSTAAGTSLAITLGSDGAEEVVLGGSSGLSDLAGPITVNGPTSGSAGYDQILLLDGENPTGSTYTFTGTNVSRPSFGGLTYNGFPNVNLAVGSGPDTFNIDSNLAGTNLTIEPPPPVRELDAAPQVDGGASGGPADVFNLGTGNLDAIQGQIVLATDRPGVLNINDQASTSMRDYDLDNSVFTWGASSGNVDFFAVNSLAVTLNGGSASLDSYNIINTASGDTYTLNTGAAINMINLGGGDLDPFNAPVTVNGSGDNNAVFVNDQANTSAHSYTLSGTSLERDGSSILTASGIQSLALKVRRIPAAPIATQSKAPPWGFLSPSMAGTATTTSSSAPRPRT